MRTGNAGASDRVDRGQIQRAVRDAFRARNRKRATRWLAVVLLIAIIAGFVAARWQFTLVYLTGDGMADALRGGDVVLCQRNDPLVPIGREQLRGQLILLKHSDGSATCEVVRRVIGLAGDEIFVTATGKVTINGEALEEPYATLRTIDPENDPGSGLLANPFKPEEIPTQEESTDDVVFPLVVPKGMLFVLSDDRNTDADSRSQGFALVDESHVLGKARAVLWPIIHMRLIREGMWDHA